MKLRCPECHVVHVGMPGDLFMCICGLQLRAPQPRREPQPRPTEGLKEELKKKVRGLFGMLEDAIAAEATSQTIDKTKK